MKNLMIGFFILWFYATGVSAQKVIASAGGSASSSSGASMSWTLGETCIGTAKSATGSSMVIGFQQPMAVKNGVVTSVVQEKKSLVSVTPNPVVKQVQITFSQEPEKGTILVIYDGQGRIIRKQMAAMDQSLNLSALSPGIYYLILSNGGQRIETIKLIKIEK
ncbi:MAG: T9SS type A sorting domain-containing protein [Bacteroidales bacterium]|nr:T9SS type A sorting domain-containing protein [Bacteroidales bacterium]